MKGQLFGLKARLGSWGEGAGGFLGQRCGWSGASIAAAAAPPWYRAALAAPARDDAIRQAGGEESTRRRTVHSHTDYYIYHFQ